MRMFETDVRAVRRRIRGSISTLSELRADIDALNDAIYETVNDGVYRAGFATRRRLRARRLPRSSRLSTSSTSGSHAALSLRRISRSRPTGASS